MEEVAKNLTEEELTILNSIDKKYKWLARDKDGVLYLFANKPAKDKSSNQWDGSGDAIKFSMFVENIFQDIKWEDSKPIKIAKAIEQGNFIMINEQVAGEEDV